jgi:hypothetical protein
VTRKGGPDEDDDSSLLYSRRFGSFWNWEAGALLWEGKMEGAR